MDPQTVSVHLESTRSSMSSISQFGQPSFTENPFNTFWHWKALFSNSFCGRVAAVYPIGCKRTLSIDQR
jgi:hypothetical protein